MAEAIETARRSGRIEALGTMLGLAGYRRQLAGRFAAWTRDERPVDGPPPGDSAVGVEEWAVFGAYREVLGRIGAEDPEGRTVWASRRLTSRPPAELRKPGQVVVVDPIDLPRSAWRLLDHCNLKARSMIVTLPFDPEPSLAELYACVDDARRQLLGWGFVEEPVRSDGFSFRAAGLVAVGRELFRADSDQRPAIPGQGLKILGGPKGEGVGLLVAREVRGRLDQGAHPDEILILVPRIDDEAGRIREALRAWGLPVEPEPVGRLATIAAVSALRLASRLPVDGWESATLARLLRNGQLHRPDLDGEGGRGRFEAASAIRATGVFRDRRALAEAIERARLEPKTRRLADMAARALRAIGEAVDSAVGPGRWPVQVDRLRQLAGSLGLEPEPLEPLWDALDDQGWVRDRLGPAVAEESWTWAEFVGQVESTIAEVVAPPSDPAPGSIRIEAVRDAESARARFVILANLAERTFPGPEAIDLGVTPGDQPTTDGRPDLAYSREMLRFARVSGAAEESLVLAFPTTDVNGEPLIPAGFLDELLRRLDDEAKKDCVERHSRFDPVLLAHPDLARSPGDARVRAVALATLGHDDAPLRALAADPAHAAGLLGVADAFEVAHRRRVDREFGPYDGLLADPRAVAKIRQDFGPDHPFSPSQIESFAHCPFQFFQRYVLGLKVVDERRELDEDYAGRGSAVHDVLQKIHEHVAAEGIQAQIIERLQALIDAHMLAVIEAHQGKPAAVPQVLREVGDRRTYKGVGRYAEQYRRYVAKGMSEPIPHKFEVAFGQEGEDGESGADSLPYLSLGEADAIVRLQGKIDRIDLVEHDGKVGFRVIDYKTGSSPSGKDVQVGLASQLPLYSLAVEQLIFPGGEHEYADAGYWSMAKDGFRAVNLKRQWAEYRESLVAFVVDLVARLRDGQFPVASQKKDCHKSCDYHATCRVKEVRSVPKVWSSQPTLGSSPGDDES